MFTVGDARSARPGQRPMVGGPPGTEAGPPLRAFPSPRRMLPRQVLRFCQAALRSNRSRRL